VPATSGSSSTLHARALTKSYGKSRGIVDVDLRVKPGEVVGLVGANGAGKTTFMRTMLDFIRPTSGAIAVFGLDSVRDSVAIRRRTTYLPGELLLPHRLSGEEVFSRFTFARPGVEPAVTRRLAERLGLDLTRRVAELSKGNKQKLGLLLAFAPPADLLVLDEPTSGLDPLLQRAVAELIAERASDGATVLLSSHVMSEVEHLASRVALLRAGRVAVVDDMDAIRARSRRHGQVRPRQGADVQPVADALSQTLRVRDVRVEHGVVSFTCTGDVDAVIKTLARFALSSVDIAQAELEDAFFSAYDERNPSDRP
jgi:ABC-2 type transport system ATP-binding protein